MKQNKLVIVVLVVIAVLFVLGLSSGLFRKKEGGGDTLTMDKVQLYKDRWVASLENVMSPMRDKLNFGRMSVPAECNPVNQSFTLTKNMDPCAITINREKGATVQKAVLSVKTGNVKVRVSYPDKEPCASSPGASSTRGAPVLFKKFKQPQATLNMSKIKPGNIQGGSGTFQQPLTLDVIYTPDGADEQSKRCEVTGPVDLTVLEKGGTLKLVCTGCNSKRSVSVALE